MFKIMGDEIYLTRGDKATIEFRIENYTFKSGDFINFRLYKKSALNSNPILDKKIEVVEEKESIDIEITPIDTKVIEMKNNPIIFWYEIELNNSQTIIGYDENGPKIFNILPEGKNPEENDSEGGEE